MRICCRRATLLSAFLLGLLTQSVVGEVATLDVANVTAVGTAVNKTGFCFVNKDGQVVRWLDGAKHVIVDDVAAPPSLLMQASRLAWRMNFVSVIGVRDSMPGVATFRLAANPELPAKFVVGLSTSFPFAKDKTVHAVIMTPIMIYVAVESANGTNEIWRIVANTSSYGEPVLIYEGERPVRALGMNYQGHLLAAINDDSNSTLQFHHALTGDVLLTVPTELNEVRAIAFGADELLYVAATQGETSGVYRVDVAYRERKQVGIERLMQEEPGIRSLSAEGEHLVTVSGERVTRLKLPSSSGK